ncbi:tol-pal system protein YbgF [Alkalidesulfovibrio alkalitolerans DSM 16529]|uniref:Tol-pal system protein YbgF n=1 Tax=Alkalidesulfovibrio alkalitolerans DSM 16529 TaxID=1121439 RepID=S7T544_9BACT|nr:tol-pal system protein YbgF [Alkalidesulfovibrio alkalitolerans]EPR31625.1 tol-pal system protein YbgF [Alkalidesulfovibrio alkalitolerans DSM 16529]
MPRVLIVFAMLAMLGGCAAAKNDAPGSEEWRLRNIEDGFLQFQEEQRRQDADLQRMEKDTAARLAVLEERVSRLEERMRLAADVGAISAAPAPQPEAPTLPATPVTPPAPSVEPAPAPRLTAVDEQALYEQGVRQVMGENYASGREILTNFLERHPDSGLAPNALYWLGETYYGEKRYAQSILTFREVLEKHPKHPKAPDALLKIGYAYEKLGDIPNARFYLQAVLDEYPKADSATKAKAMLRQLPQ